MVRGYHQELDQNQHMDYCLHQLQPPPPLQSCEQISQPPEVEVVNRLEQSHGKYF